MDSSTQKYKKLFRYLTFLFEILQNRGKLLLVLTLRAISISNTHSKICSCNKYILIYELSQIQGEIEFLIFYNVILRIQLTYIINHSLMCWMAFGSQMAAQKANVQFQKLFFSSFCQHPQRKRYFFQEHIFLQELKHLFQDFSRN